MLYVISRIFQDSPQILLYDCTSKISQLCVGGVKKFHSNRLRTRNNISKHNHLKVLDDSKLAEIKVPCMYSKKKKYPSRLKNGNHR